VQFDGTVEEAEHLFATEYWYYEHRETGGFRLACDSYKLPKHVQEHVDSAMPTIQLDGLRPVPKLSPSVLVRSSFSGGASLGSQPCETLVTIECLRELYNFSAGTTSFSGNEMGIGEGAGCLNLPNLPIFFKNYTEPEIPADTVPEFISIDGGKTANATTVQQFMGIESAIDFQTAYSIIYP
jgi:tripeptidyl-peptidase-1